MGLLVDWTRLRRESALQEVSVETFTTKKVTEEIFETRMTKNFPQFQEAQRMPIKINAKKKKTTHNQPPRRNIFKEQGQQCKTVIDVVDTNPVISNHFEHQWSKIHQ